MESLDMLQYVDMKQDMQDSNDGSYMDEDSSSQPVYMITTATQTLPCSTRKIKPIKHPGLVLKTPIAYQSNTDPNVIPIDKNGIGKNGCSMHYERLFFIYILKCVFFS